MSITREQLHEALANLYHGAALGQVAFADHFDQVACLVDPLSRAQRLRGILLDAIEELQPPRPETFRSPETRGYRILTMHFVEGLTIAQVAEELNVSERQSYRDLVRAEASLGELLESYRSRRPSETGRAAQREVQRELDRLTVKMSTVDVVALVQSALDLVAPLAGQQAVQVRADLPAMPVSALVSPGMFKQALVQMLSAAIRANRRGPVQVTLECQPGALHVAVDFVAASRRQFAESIEQLQDLVRAQGLTWRTAWGQYGQVRTTITLSRTRRLALVVEDNESAVELYHRFLAARDDWELLQVSDTEALLPLAAEHSPAVIVLDIMMPDRDGWSLLQMLKAAPETRDIPVLVCTVFEEGKLAQALGASAFCKKPVTRGEFIAALDHCCQSSGSWARQPAGRT